MGTTQWNAMVNALNAGRNVVSCTWGQANQLSTNALVANHCYTVLRTESETVWNGWTWVTNQFVVLRNPWGVDHNNGTSWGDPSDGIVRVSWNDFARSMQGFWTN